MEEPTQITVIIETPKGSTEKYDYVPEHKCFKLDKIMPLGMSFPFDFGFIPDTKGEDGDPLDVMVISEFKSFSGCMMDCRIIGAILAEQTSPRQHARNDRYIAVSTLSTIFSDIQRIDDLPAKKIEELQQFFINYNKIAGKEFKVLKMVNPKEALKLIESQKKRSIFGWR